MKRLNLGFWVRLTTLVFFLVVGRSEALAQWKPLHLSSKVLQKKLMPKKFALVIGINHFHHPHWEPLRFARRDAEQMGEALRGLAGFHHVIFRTRKENTTKAAILKALARLGKRLRHRDDLLFVYISAHGTVAKHPRLQKEERFIITADTNLKVAETALSVPFLVSTLKKYTSKRVVLMLATCYNGKRESKSYTPLGKKGASERGKVLPRRLKSRSIQILSAASYAQSAFESASLRADIYTHFFLRCLRDLKKAKNSLSTIEVHVCATRPTTLFVKKSRGAIQVPRVDSELGANHDIDLLSSTAEQYGHFVTSNARKGLWRYWLRNWRGEKGSVLSSDEVLRLPVGRYRVARLSLGGKLLEERAVVILPQQVTSLGSPWSLEVQSGYLGSALAGSGWLAGGYLGLHQEWFHLRLGVWGTSTGVGEVERPQLYLELRPELGYNVQLGFFDVFLGGYVAAGLLLQHVGGPLGYGPVFRYGATLSPSLWVTPAWRIGLGVDAGFSVLSLGLRLQHLFDWSLRLGVLYRL